MKQLVVLMGMKDTSIIVLEFWGYYAIINLEKGTCC